VLCTHVLCACARCEHGHLIVSCAFHLLSPCAHGAAAIYRRSPRHENDDTMYDTMFRLSNVTNAIDGNGGPAPSPPYRAPTVPLLSTQEMERQRVDPDPLPSPSARLEELARTRYAQPCPLWSVV
jgi:hypothetical protein